jgi:Zn-dependent protease
LAADFFPVQYEGWRPTTYWPVGAATAVLFFASALLHEQGHSAVALRKKVPVTSITLVIFGGAAQTHSTYAMLGVGEPRQVGVADRYMECSTLRTFDPIVLQG